MRIIASFIAALFCAACAGEITYLRPTSPLGVSNAKTVPRSKEDVWTDLIPALGSQFFVINNLDRDSGLINVSYTGEPEQYVDCGRINSVVTNARGTRTYDFPVATAFQRYEVMDVQSGSGLWDIQQNLSLEGRINLIVQEIGPSTTLVTANTRYVVTRSIRQVNAARGFPDNYSETISFGPNETAAFANSSLGVSCRPTGKLERDLLALVN